MKHGMNQFQAVDRLLQIILVIIIKVNPSKWEYLKEFILKRKRTKICITCNHFFYNTIETFITMLICPRYEKLVLQVDYLLKVVNISKNRTIFSPKAS